MKLGLFPRFLLIAFGSAALVCAAAFFLLPMPLAIICPKCVDFREAGNRTFIERASSNEQAATLIKDLDVSRASVSTFFGGQQSDPVIFACISEACYSRMAGHMSGARGLSFFSSALLLSPRRMGSTIATHEMSHLEFHKRIGVARMAGAGVPAWFDEGLATYIARDDRYINLDAANPCLKNSDTPLPMTQLEWNVAAEKDHSVYAVATCRVAKWVAPQGGPRAVSALIATIKAGTSFEGAFNSPVRQ